ncbi:MAG: DUF2141 domain-containing protein [Cyclobacteriaceae bacterium]
MKNLITVMIISCLAFNGYSQGTFEVEVSNLSVMEGTIYAQVFNSEGDYLKKAFAQALVEVSENEPVVLKFENLPFGTYAMNLYHDENSSEELETGMFGIPKEGYAFSNNAKGMFGPPGYEDTQFEFKADMKMKVELIHPPF